MASKETYTSLQAGFATDGEGKKERNRSSKKKVPVKRER
jgi:hypothetical protein